MTATITGTGVLSFKFKINAEPSYKAILRFKGFNGGYAYIYADSDMVDNEWHDGPYDQLTAGILYSEGRFVKSEPGTVEVEWMYKGGSGECWIDQVKWIPDGGGQNVEFDTGVVMDETSKAMITNIVINHWDEILREDAGNVSTILLTGDDLTNAFPLLGLGFAPKGTVADSTATMRFGGETRIVIASYGADDLSSMILSAIVTNTVLGLPSWSTEAASVLGVWGATTLTSGWSRVESGEPDLSGYLTGGEVSWTGVAASTNRFFKVIAQ